METPLPFRWRHRVVWAVGLFALISCSSSMVMQSALDETTRAYADALRWRKAEGLSSFAASPLREEFEARLSAFGDVVITEYRIVSVEFDEHRAMAVVEADITYYKANSYRVKTIRDRQVWSYAESNGHKGWQLTTLLPVFP